MVAYSAVVHRETWDISPGLGHIIEGVLLVVLTDYLIAGRTEYKPANPIKALIEREVYHD